MKILISLLLLTLGVNANEVVYGSKSGRQVAVGGGDGYLTSGAILEVGAGELLEIIGVTGGRSNDGGRFTNTTISILTQHDNQPPAGLVDWYCETGNSTRAANNSAPAKQVVVGPCKVFVRTQISNTYPIWNWQVSYKLTKPSAAGTTTSAPILLPPTQDAAKSWFVKLQVSSDLKAWDDVAPGQFLGSDTARFFRIQTTEAE